jgi:hypothetical protein
VAFHVARRLRWVPFDGKGHPRNLAETTKPGDAPNANVQLQARKRCWMHA